MLKGTANGDPIIINNKSMAACFIEPRKDLKSSVIKMNVMEGLPHATTAQHQGLQTGLEFVRLRAKTNHFSRRSKGSETKP